LLAVAGADGMVQLWNPTNGQPAGPLIRTGPGGGVRALAFSPSGLLLATAGADGWVRLWNPFTGQLAGAPIPADTGSGGGVAGVAFSPRGGLLASADAAGTVRLWNVSLFAHPYTTLCTDVGAPTRQEWAQNASGEPQPKFCT
jgi:WD40 repeat protein